MIFITLGSQDRAFPRILRAVETQINKGVIKEEVIAQIGSTDFKSDKMKIIKLTKSFDEYMDYIERASLIITHGGVGSILDGITHNKKVIAIPRLKKYGENTNDHQIQIIEKFSEEKYIIGIDNVSGLGKAIKKSKNFKPKPYKRDNSKMLKTIENFIDNI